MDSQWMQEYTASTDALVCDILAGQTASWGEEACLCDELHYTSRGSFMIM